MNERIKELYKLTIGRDWAYDFDTEYAEKFAELIVRDVVATVKRTQVTSSDFEWAILNNYDFGVEK